VHGAAPDSKVPFLVFQKKSPSARSENPLIGFLRVNRSVLAISATAFVVVAIGIHEIPAQAAAAQAAIQQALGAQSVAVPASVAPADVTRDGFAVTSYTTVQWPVDPSSPVASGFGYRISPCAGCSSFHEGTDFDPGRGTPIAAIADGVVTEVGNPSGSLGVYAIIRHSIDGVTFSSLYGHMELGSLRLSVGQTVTRGQLVGLVGDTGASTGSHLHFGIEDASGTLIDSLVWIREYANVPYSPAS
jgi:murein DD-endopeptidase MepM/ murein hydrolase activator NlpD